MDSALRNYYLNVMGITRWIPRIFDSDNTPTDKESTFLSSGSFIDWYDKNHADPEIIFLAEINNAAEQELFPAIIRACAQQQTHACGKLTAEIVTAQDFISAFPMSCTRILIFGINQAKLLDLTFTKPGFYSLGSIKICVTYTLQELITQPNYKKELWQAWQHWKD